MKQWNKRLVIHFLIMILLAFLTLTRNFIWYSEYAIWKDTITKSPYKARPYNNMGTAAERERLFGEAVWAYEKAIDLYRRDMLDPSPSMNAYYNLGMMYIEIGMKEDAVNVFRNLLSIGLGAYYNDDVIDNLIKRLDILFNKSKNIHSNSAGLNPVLRGDIYNSLGAVYLAVGLNELAVLMFQKSLKYNPQNAEVYNNLGALYLKRGYLNASINEFEKAVKMNPKFADAYSNMGFAYSDKGDFETALNLHLKAIEFNPEYANAHYGLALVYEKFGNKEKALKHWLEYIKFATEKSSWVEEAKRHIININTLH